MSTKKRILDDVEAALRRIDPAGGFHTQVTTVERGLKTWDEAKPGEMPYLGFAAVGQRFAPQPNRCYRVTLRIKVVAHVNESDPSDRERALDWITDDVIAAISEDVTRSNNAITTLVEATATDEVDPFVRAHGTLELTFECPYLRGIGVTP